MCTGDTTLSVTVLNPNAPRGDGRLEPAQEVPQAWYASGMVCEKSNQRSSRVGLAPRKMPKTGHETVKENSTESQSLSWYCWICGRMVLDRRAGRNTFIVANYQGLVEN